MNLDRVKALRREIEELSRTDQSLRLNGDRIGWDQRKAHDERIARLYEIQGELKALLAGKELIISLEPRGGLS